MCAVERTVILVAFVLATAHVVIRRLRQLGRQAQGAASAVKQRAIDHDLASALLAVEGGLISLRSLHTAKPATLHEALVASQQAGRLSRALEKEIQRIRRLADGEPVVEACFVDQAIEPAIQLRRAAGADIMTVYEDDVLVDIPADDLARCVSNLLDNCERYAPESSIVISGVRVDNYFQLSVSDDGLGLIHAIRNDPFRHDASSRPGGGLGLHSVRTIAEEHGGSVRIESSPHGTTVHLRLRVDEVTAQLLPTAQRSNHEVGSHHR